MKTLIYIFALFLYVSSPMVFAQDTIIKKNGDELLVKVTDLQHNMISYKMINDNEGLEYRLPKQEVLMVMYDDNTKVMFPSASEGDTFNVTPSDRHEELYFMGERDAELYYKGNGAMWGTFGATIIFTPVGLVTGIAAGAVPPNIENTAPEYELLNEAAYREGYTKKARKKKWGKVVAGFGLGLLTNILVYSIASGSN